ncbi:PIN domain-containing protein [Cecembia lonarensis]|uniref:PIN domain-containing protein n=1 Tax=Cecembia lonarensis (strain CCUG 58316 / KCTC 22772 / LW9) TaxID=1225176 RepID=K1LXI2_CECL9|nr:PIN domain-containing protein [Cecembia lonarensis]EKB48909.1 hypothetical protein B879_02477 [Cecembia lonarensis LW9]
MRLFLDANVLVAVLNHEYPVFSYAARVLSLVDKPNFQVYTSPICLAIAYYFSEKKSGSKIAQQKLQILSEKIKSTSVDQSTVNQASMFPYPIDFEDALEYYSTLDKGCDVLITEDINDFHFSEIPVMNCQDFIRQFFGSRKK